MKNYIKPEIKVIDFDVTDVIATSGGGGGENPPITTAYESLAGIKTVFEDTLKF